MKLPSSRFNVTPRVKQVLQLLLLNLCLLVPGHALAQTGAAGEWRFWGGDQGASHYSTLEQINPTNVASLEIAWRHRSGDHYDGSDRSRATVFQVTPLVINDTLYYCTPFQRVFALNPETGEEIWQFDPQIQELHGKGPYPLNCRGLSWWEDKTANPAQHCSQRIIYGTSDSDLIALDANNGKPCENFGDNGRVALREALDEDRAWAYHPTSAPLVMHDRIVINGFVADNLDVNSTPGVVRAFDVHSGEMVWAWDSIPPNWQGELNPQRNSQYHSGTPNSWSTMTGDAERGLVFVPTGNPSPDLYGGERNGIDYFGSSTVALDIHTGKLAWHYQFVHHDVWDFDTPSPPTLFQIPGVGNGVAALAQTTKPGHIFLLNRETGQPLYPVEERPVPQGGVPGEQLSPTQPFPTHPAPLHSNDISPQSAHGFTFLDKWECKRLIKKYRWDGAFTPPTLEGSITYPHSSGGMGWGGVAIDPERKLLLVNQNQIALVTKLVPRAEAEAMDTDNMVYPMEYFPMRGTPYAALRFPLFSSFGAPCSATPWGELMAIDLETGEPRWQIPFGTLDELAPWPVGKIFTQTGAPNFSGGMATASGLFFIGATMDNFFRAYNSETGEELWRTRLPFVSNAVPMTYLGKSGKQYVVVAAGGNGLTEMGDALTAYTLPANR